MAKFLGRDLHSARSTVDFNCIVSRWFMFGPPCTKFKRPKCRGWVPSLNSIALSSQIGSVFCTLEPDLVSCFDSPHAMTLIFRMLFGEHTLKPQTAVHLGVALDPRALCWYHDSLRIRPEDRSCILQPANKGETMGTTWVDSLWGVVQFFEECRHRYEQAIRGGLYV